MSTTCPTTTNGPASLTLPGVVQGDTFWEMKFVGDQSGNADLVTVVLTVSTPDSDGWFLKLDNDALGGIVIDDATLWSFTIEEFATDCLPVGCFPFKIFYTLADGKEITAWTGTWTIKQK